MKSAVTDFFTGTAGINSFGSGSTLVELSWESARDTEPMTSVNSVGDNVALPA